jgi:hypothetical protein
VAHCRAAAPLLHPVSCAQLLLLLHTRCCSPLGLLFSTKLRLPAMAPCSIGGAAEHGRLPPGAAVAAAALVGSNPRYSCRLYAARAAKEFKLVVPLQAHTPDTAS